MPIVPLSPDRLGDIHIGDVVHVLAIVTRRFGGCVEVTIRGQSSLIEALLEEDQLAAVEVPDPSAEPPNGTWIVADRDTNTAELNVFVRDDANAPTEHTGPHARRWPLRWRDLAGGAGWVDWPTVIHRGGNPQHTLTRSIED